MRKTVDIKTRVVDMYDVDTGTHEGEVVKYLDKNMLVRFHSASFNNKNYTFLGKPAEQAPYSLTVSEYKKREDSDSSAVIIS